MPTFVEILFYLQVKPSLAKVLLLERKWEVKEIETLHKKDPKKLLIDCRITPEVHAQVHILYTFHQKNIFMAFMVSSDRAYTGPGPGKNGSLYIMLNLHTATYVGT